MIKITVIALGKLKEKYLREASCEYEKRLTRYCRLNIIELNPVNLPEKPSQSEIEAALLKEAEQIERRIPEGSAVAAFCVEGESLSSEGFSALISKNTDCGKNMCFIIGSSYGLADVLKQRADFRISMSEMTFPLQLFRIMCLEQIYRSFKIIEGSTYHK